MQLVLLGTVSAVKRNTVYDNVATTLAVLGRAVPNFWLSIMLIVVFGAYLKWLPPSGYGTWRHIIMPAVALSAGLAALVARLTRSRLLEVMGHDFVRTHSHGRRPAGRAPAGGRHHHGDDLRLARRGQAAHAVDLQLRLPRGADERVHHLCHLRVPEPPHRPPLRAHRPADPL